MTDALFTNQPEQSGENTRFEGTLNVPLDARVTSMITNQWTITPDHWDVSIIPMSEFVFENAQPYRQKVAMARHKNGCRELLPRHFDVFSDVGPL